MSEAAESNIRKEIAALEKMTVGQLQKRYADAFREPARSGNRQWLLRRVAWRLQMLAEGDLAERALDRSRGLAKDLARDADLRVRPPAGSSTSTAVRGGVVTTAMPFRRDERVPPPGTVLRRRFKGRDYQVTVLPNGFEFDGEVYRSLSAAAYAISGSHWNGMLFFGLSKPKASGGDEE